MSTVGADKWTPPYVSWATLNNMIDRMVSEGSYPERIDRSYLRNLPGGAQSELITALKALDLTDDDSQPSETLKRMVANPDQRPQLFREILERRYAGPLSLSQHATQLQLEEAFRKLGVQGSTLRKAVRFFLTAAAYSGIDLSQHFRTPRAESATPRRRRPATNERDELQEQEQQQQPQPESNLHPFIQGLVETLPQPGSYFPEDRQEAWFDTARGIFRLIYAPSPERANPGGETLYLLDLSDADASEPDGDDD